MVSSSRRGRTMSSAGAIGSGGNGGAAAAPASSEKKLEDICNTKAITCNVLKDKLSELENRKYESGVASAVLFQCLCST